jgi:hypothetical protein
MIKNPNLLKAIKIYINSNNVIYKKQILKIL